MNIKIVLLSHLLVLAQLASALPNLSPYQPTEWDLSLVTSSSLGGYFDTTLVTTSDVFVDFAWEVTTSESAGPHSTRLFLNGNPVFTSSDSDGLAEGFYNLFDDVNLGMLTAGTHILTVQIDYLDQVSELNEVDNTVTKEIVVVDPATGLPNLTSYWPSESPYNWSGPIVISSFNNPSFESPIVEGDEAYLSFSLMNDGGVDSTNYKAKLFLNDVEYDELSGSGISSGFFTRWEGISLGVLDVGIYEVRIELDSADQNLEEDETDNTFSYVFHVLDPDASYPDLWVYKPAGWSDHIVLSNQTGGYESTELFVGENVYYDLSVVNFTDVDAGAFNVHVYLDGDFSQRLFASSGLLAGYSGIWDDINLGHLAEGEHTLEVYVDRENQVLEEDDTFSIGFTANYESQTFTVTRRKPDLTIGQSDGGDPVKISNTPDGVNNEVVRPGDLVYLYFSLLNQGSLVAGAFETEVYLNENLITSVEQGNALEVGESIDYAPINVGSLGAGQHTIELLVDISNQQDESEESNNSYEYTFTVYEVPADNDTLRVVSNIGQTVLVYEDDVKSIGTFGGKLYSFKGSPEGMGLWVKNDSNDQWSLLKEVSDSLYGDVSELVGSGSHFYFSVESSFKVIDLWRSDGTVDGTSKVVTFESDPDDYKLLSSVGDSVLIERDSDVDDLEELVLLNTLTLSEVVVDAAQYLSYRAYELEERVIMWEQVGKFLDGEFITATKLLVSDGTVLGTSIMFESTAVDVEFGATYGNFLFYMIGSVLWETDGTAEGTRAIHDFGYTSGFTFYNDGSQLYIYSDGDNGIWGYSPGDPMLSFIVSAGYSKISSDYAFEFASPTLKRWNLLTLESNVIYTAPSGDSLTTNFSDVFAGGITFKIESSNVRYYYSAGTAQSTREVDVADLKYPSRDLYHEGNLYHIDADFSDEAGILYHYSFTDFEDEAVPAPVAENNTIYRAALTSDDYFYFTAYTEILGTELWRSDGTLDGTHLFNDLYAGSESSGVSVFKINEDTAYIYAKNEAGTHLWNHDLVSDSLSLIKTIESGSDVVSGSGVTDLVLPNGKLLATLRTAAHGYELWTSDGTASGTKLLKDIWGGSGSGFPSGFTLIGNSAVFAARDSTRGTELWISDGTSSGTRLLKDIYSGSSSSSPSNFRYFNNNVYFYATDETAELELWKTDGTTWGTVRVKDINPNGNSPVEDFIVWKGELYFGATDGDSEALWKTDGTSAGTVKVLSGITFLKYSSYTMHVLGELLFFIDEDEALWATNGAPEGTYRVTPDGVTLGGANLFTYNGKFYFPAGTGQSGREFWTSDGTREGTHLLVEFSEGKTWSYASGGFTEQNGILYFQAYTKGEGDALWAMTVANLPAFNHVGGLEVSVDENSADNAIPLASLSVSDSSESDILTWAIETLPENGVVSVSGSAQTPTLDEQPVSARYTPNPNFTGVDTFTISVSDGVLSDYMQVSVNVLDLNPELDDINSLIPINSQIGLIADISAFNDTNGLTFTIKSGNDAGLFSISSLGKVMLLSSFDQEIFSLGDIVSLLVSVDDEDADGDADDLFTLNFQLSAESYSQWLNRVGLLPQNTAMTASPFGDNVSNLMKYAFNMNAQSYDRSVLVPTTGMKGLPFFELVPREGEVKLAVEFIKRRQSGLNYSLLGGEDLSEEMDSVTATPIVTPINSEWERIRYDLLFNPELQEQQFFKISVSVD